MPTRNEEVTKGLSDEERAPGRAAAAKSDPVVEDAAAKAVPHFTRAERAARGKAARAEVPRSAQAEIDFPKRRDPVALLEEQAVVARARAGADPLRADAGVAVRLLPRRRADHGGGSGADADSGLRVQLCGDAHLSNFGVFGSPERNLVFDINDFDETAPGPWEWDVKRLAASFAIAGRENGFSGKERRAVVLDTVRSYREAMAAFAQMRNLDVWYAHLSVEQAVAEFTRRRRPEAAEEGGGQHREGAHQGQHAGLREADAPRRRRAADHQRPAADRADRRAPPRRRSSETRSRTRCATSSARYRRTLETDRRHLLEQFRFVDLARKVVGVGSVGTRAWIALFLGTDEHDPLFLQIKEAQPSVLEHFVGKSEYSNCGQRVVAGQRLMQATSDIFLGWQHVSSGLDGQERDFYVRQLKDWKGSFAFEAAVPAGAAAYGKACGWTLARAHARSGDRIAIASYLGKSDAFDQAIAAFAETYADQNERDYNALKDAVSSGRINARDRPLTALPVL